MKHKFIILALGLGFLASSCNDLDLVPLSEASTENWYSSEEELLMAANEFYKIGYWNKMNQGLLEQATDNFTYRNVNRCNLLDGTVNGDGGTENWYPVEQWQSNYKCITMANTFLEKSERAEKAGVSEKILNQYRGEAYFTRACKYAVLVSFFGDVVWLDKNIYIEEAFQKGRTPKKEIIPLIYQDFDKAISMLPVSYTGNSTQRFTKGAALAMKARFALYMGDWELAAESAKACMNLQAYQLNPDFSDLFLMNTKNSIEGILVCPLSVQYNILYDATATKNELPRNAGGYGSYAPSWDLLASFLCTDGLPIDESPLFDPHNPFKNRDPRCTATIVEFGTRHCSFDFDPHPDALKVMNYKTGKMVTNQDTRANAQYTSFNAFLWQQGIDDSFARTAIGRYGADNAKAMREGMKNPDDFAEFANEFGTDHNREIYEMEVVEKTEDRLSIDFHYCPYVTEWVKQGHTPEEIAHLCDLTMEGDREFAKQFPCLKFELKGTIADGLPVCQLRFTKVKKD